MFLSLNTFAANSSLDPAPSASPLADNMTVSSGVQETPTTAGTIVIDKNTAWDKIELNSRTLFNNIWGVPLNETLTSGVYSDQNKGFGWY